MAIEDTTQAINADNARRLADNARFSAQDRQTFALALAGLSTDENITIDMVVAAVNPPRAVDGMTTTTLTGDDLISFELDLEHAQYLAQEHSNAKALIEDMVANGIPRSDAVAEISAAIPEYQQVEDARIAIEASYEIGTGGNALDPRSAAAALSFDMTNAYAYGDGISGMGSILGNTAEGIEFIESMPPVEPVVNVEVGQTPTVGEMDTPSIDTPTVDNSRETEAAEEQPQVDDTQALSDMQIIEADIREKIAAGQTPAEATAGVVLNRADSHRHLSHIPYEDFNLMAKDIQASLEQEQGIVSTSNITSEQLVAMQNEAAFAEGKLSNLNLNTSTTEARLVSTDPKNANETGQAEAATILFNSSENPALLTTIAETEGLVVLNDRDGNGIEIDSDGDKTIGNAGDIRINVTDSSLENPVENSLIGAKQLDALIAAAEQLELDEINLNVGSDGIADPSNPELADLAATIRQEAETRSITEIETAKIEAITLEMMAQGGQSPDQLWGNAVGEYHRGNDDPNKLSAEETMIIVRTTFQEELQRQSINPDDIGIIFEDSDEMSVAARLVEDTNLRADGTDTQFTDIVSEGREDLIGTEEDMVVIQENFGDGSKPMTVTVADVDGDGIDEVLTINLNESGGIDNGETVISMDDLQAHIAEALKGGVTEITLNEDSNGVVTAPTNVGVSQQNDGVQR